MDKKHRSRPGARQARASKVSHPRQARNIRLGLSLLVLVAGFLLAFIIKRLLMH